MKSKKVSLMPQDSVLADLRISIDNIDSALITLLAERFRLTRKVGKLKCDAGLPAIDPQREADLLAAIEQRALVMGLSPVLATTLWRVIIDEVVASHNALKQMEGRHE